MAMIGLRELLTTTKSALAVVDVQNDFCHPDGAMGKKGLDVSPARAILPPLRELLACARECGVPVIFIRNAEDDATDTAAWVMRPDGDENSPNAGITRRGSWGAEFCELTPAPEDIVVEKHRFSAFLNTRLETVLKTYRIETLVFAGLATNVCVATSATHAVMMGYHVVLAEDACAAWSEEAHAAAVNNIRLFVGKVARCAEVEACWRARR